MEVCSKRSLKKLQAIGIIALFLMGGQLGCGLNAATSSTSCAEGTAQIGIMDGAVKRICGCTETSGAVFTGTNFSCTVSAQTRLIFYFTNIQVQHRIQIQGTAQTTMQMNPSSSSVQVDANIFMGTTGTFTFIDANNTSMGGTITVN